MKSRFLGKLFLLASVIVFSMSPAHSRRARTYQKGLLVDMNVDRFVTGTNFYDSYYESPQYIETIRTKSLNGRRSRTRTNISSVHRSRRGGSNTYIDTDYYFTINLGGVLYETRYNPFFDSFFNPLWIVGDPIDVRFSTRGSRLYLRKPNGRELKTRIIRRYREPTEICLNDAYYY